HTHTHTHTHTGALGRKQMHFIPKIHKELNHSLSVVTFRTLHLTLPLPTSDILPFSISLSLSLSPSLRRLCGASPPPPLPPPPPPPDILPFSISLSLSLSPSLRRFWRARGLVRIAVA